MKCKNCKRQIDDDSIYCKYCGTKQIKDRDQISVPRPKKLPSGTWNANMMIKGQRVSVSADTEREYYAKARALKAGLLEAVKAGPRLTLGTAIRNYIDANTNVLSPATIRGYEIIYNNRFKSYQDKAIDQIDYQRMINEEAAVKSAKTVHNAWGLVHRALDYAGHTPPRVNLPQKTPYNGDWLDYKQIQTFLKAIRGERVELAAILALHSLRQSELLALTTDSIKDNNIIVAGAKVRDKDQNWVYKQTNKTANSSRTIPILIPRLLELLPESGPLVTLHESVIRRELLRICDKAGLPAVTLHDLRRSFASLAYHLKWSDRTTMQVGGWSDIATIKAVYEKLSTADRDRDIKRMEKFYKP